MGGEKLSPWGGGMGKKREGGLWYSTRISCLQLGGAPPFFRVDLFRGGVFCFYFGPLGQKKRRATVKLLGVCHKRNKNREREGEGPPILTRGRGSL